MRCPIETREEAEILLAYCSRRLDPESTAALEQHIAACRACREFAAGQQAIWAALDTWEAAPVSADFDRKLYRRAEKEGSWWDLLLLPFRPLMARTGLPIAASAVLAIAAGVLLEQPAAGPPNTVPTSAAAESVAPEQAEHALQEMDAMRQFSQLIRSDAADPRM